MSGALRSLPWLLLAACSGAAGAALPVEAPAPMPATAPGTTTAPGFLPGETMAFEVTLGGMLVGEAALAVGQRGTVSGVDALSVRSRLATAGAVALIKTVEDDVTTTLDADSGLPMHVASDVTFGDSRYHSDAEFSGSSVKVRWTRPTGKGSGVLRFHFGQASAVDSHAAMAQIRQWQASAGERRTLWVLSGKRLWRADITMGGREVMGSRLGNRRAVRLTGVAYRSKPDLSVEPGKAPRRFEVWISDDADRVPLRVNAITEYGNVIIDLIDYQRPAS
jgi:hypothetical protein